MEEIKDPWESSEECGSNLRNFKFQPSRAPTSFKKSLDEDHPKMMNFFDEGKKMRDSMQLGNRRIYERFKLKFKDIYARCSKKNNSQKIKVNKETFADKVLDNNKESKRYQKFLDYYNQGKLSYSGKKYAYSIKYFNAAINSGAYKYLSEDKYINLCLMRAISYNSRGNYDLAFKDFTTVISYRENDPDLYFKRGNTCLSNNQFPSAILDYNKAIDLKKDPDYFLARGNAKEYFGKYEDALNDFIISNKLQPMKDFAELKRRILERIIYIENSGEYINAISKE